VKYSIGESPDAEFSGDGGRLLSLVTGERLALSPADCFRIGTARSDGGGEDGIMACEGSRHHLGVLLPEPGEAHDVGREGAAVREGGKRRAGEEGKHD
jgi:hypothetical protein